MKAMPSLRDRLRAQLADLKMPVVKIGHDLLQQGMNFRLRQGEDARADFHGAFAVGEIQGSNKHAPAVRAQDD